MRKIAKVGSLLFLCFAIFGDANAEFIANVPTGPAQGPTRAAAASGFAGYQSFYAGMAQLEQQQVQAARESFAAARSQFLRAQEGYRSAAGQLSSDLFDERRLAPEQLGALRAFAEQFGGSVTQRGDGMLVAFSNSFAALIQVVDRLATQPTLANFQRVHSAINRQIMIGAIISAGFRMSV